MKSRLRFVSNSSTSSYVCDISGEITSGYDLTLSDAHMSTCPAGHVFSNSYLLPVDHDAESAAVADLINQANSTKHVLSYLMRSKKSLAQVSEQCGHQYIRINNELSIHDPDTVPPYRCPVCQMAHLPVSLMARYLAKKLTCADRATVTATIRDEFGNDFERFSAWIDDVKGF